ncbi:MAG: cysteine desulfurase family protein [Bacilli bacterium]|nr:cysteine desulfurase family protein [Bacilli bacterium]
MIYLDNAATTQPSRALLDIYQRLESDFFANVNSNHQAGRSAEKYLLKARTIILEALTVDASHRAIFVSSATEANNLALKGFALKHQNRGKHIIISNIEHPSVYESVIQLRDQFGFEVTVLNVNHKGQVRPEDVRAALKKTTIIVSIMAVNNEVGSLNPIKEIAAIVHRHSKAVLHVDTTQAIGKISLPYQDIDMFCISGHKINALKGSGALIFKKTIDFLPLLSGGNQEFGFRSSTVSVALAYTLAIATKEAIRDQQKVTTHVASLSSYVRSYFAKQDNIVINSPDSSSPYIFNFSLTDKKASVVVEALSNEGIMISSVSACHHKLATSSYVVKALGRSEELANNTLRISFDKMTKLEDIQTFIEAYEAVIARIRT